MRVFKSTSAIAVNRLLGREGTPVWQRSYYEHILRGGADLTRVERYVLENPTRWSFDPENPIGKAAKSGRTS